MTAADIDARVVHAIWTSSTYPNMHGTCDFRIDSPKQMTIVFRYSANAPFRAGKQRLFTLSYIAADSRVVAQSVLNTEQQLLFTFSFDKSVVSGFYSSIIPIDCGALKPIENKSRWQEVFGMD